MPLRHWVVGLAVIGLAGCTLLNPRVSTPAKKLDCEAGNACSVVVSVECPRYFECDMRVDYDLVFVQARDQVDIRWVLRGEPGAEFAANGIVIDNSAFECRAEAKDAFVCRDRHPEFGIFKYAIHVTVKDSVFGPRGVQSLDPWIVNH